MRFSALASLALSAFAVSLWGAAVTPTASVSLSATATAVPKALSPSSVAPASISPVAAAVSLSPTPAAEPDVQDDEVTATATVLDYGKAETKLLTSICEATTNDDDKFLYNLAENQRTERAGQGVAEIQVVALYNELAKRTVDQQADARQALVMAILRGDERAKIAKDGAYENKLAATLIKRLKNGDKGAQPELEALAAKGNDLARAYFGMDKPASIGIPEAMTGTSVPVSVSPVATATMVTVSPTVTAVAASTSATAKPLSGTAK